MSAGARRARSLGRSVARISLLLALVIGALFATLTWMTRMPGDPHTGPLPPPTELERELAARLEHDVRHLALDIGPRDPANPQAVSRAADWIEAELRAAGYEVERQPYTVGAREEVNLIAELAPPRPAADGGVVILGAHYDTAPGTPGANDNGTGVAALLALARAFADAQLPRGVRFVAFATEEPPFFDTEHMGSRHYARRCRERGEDVVAMLSLETLGYYTDAPGSQSYPPLVGSFYPDRGDFVAVVGNPSSRALVRRVVETFRGAVAFPCQGGALPGFLPGVGWSDHASFWHEGYPAVMLTDTAPFRDPHYHRESDLPERLDYARLARVVLGVGAVIEELAADTP